MLSKSALMRNYDNGALCFYLSHGAPHLLHEFQLFLERNELVTMNVTTIHRMFFYNDDPNTAHESAITFRLMVLEAFLDEQGIE